MITQLARFGAVGIAAMAVHWIIVALLVPFGIAPLIANIIGFAIAFNVSYFGHRNWTFNSAAAHSNTFTRFLTVAIASFLLNEAMYSLLLRFTALDYRVALFIVLGAVAALTFVLSRYWAFRQA
ncbi:MAG: GtrA family protein [Verrucomicrobiaceae bacterium]|nr:GtrA family protein [Verrucomicrobiaceae bacterium]